ncbi:TonB-dependent receptor [Rhodocytophaga rosea]|uniref:TonB-dependent receptor n=1 Tax=Rhodocytophaga rosea TaxID=2704465 RepID=A0A6C0GS46_9BACT|nr:outer membrane beta-barrel family protein [Rhodocytophaga rosea]QHT70889.1 TonB-dependent receptor [Rhodocytophaga rosea]
MKNLLPFPDYFSRHYLCLLLLSGSLPCLAQSQVGGIVQEDNGKPLPFATVLLLSANDSLLVKGAITTEAGEYSIEGVQAGSYRMAVSMLGYQKVYSAPFFVAASTQTIQVPLLQTSAETKQLSEVTIVGEKPMFEQQLDRMVVNVQSSITSAGATALDVLERSPGVSVNRQQNKLSLLGKAGVMIMVNGKLSRLPQDALLQMLAGMNASNIEKIELITTPPAGMDAEGNAGLINIVMKKNTDLGTNGSYSATLGYGWYERPAASLNMNHRTAKLNFFADGSFLWDHYWFSLYTNRRFTEQNQMVESSNVTNRNTHHMIYNGRMGFEYSLGGQTSLNGMVAGFNNRQEQFALNQTRTVEAADLHTTIAGKDHEINQWRHLMGNLNLQHAFQNQSKLNLDLDYLLFHHNNPHWYENDFQNWQLNTQQLEFMNGTKFTPIHIGVGKADYEFKIGKTALKTGMKATLSSLDNDVAVQKLSGEEWITEPEFTQKVQMQEQIGAAYAGLEQQLNVKTRLQAGLRWEFTNTGLTASTGEKLLKRRYHYLFPSVSLSRDLSTKHTLQLSYSRRITRPTYKDLAPVFTFLDPYTSFYGNTSLLPAITDALQVVYQIQKKYFLTLQYSSDKNPITWLMRVDAGRNRHYIYPDNIKSIHTYSVNLSIPVVLTSWWQMQNNLMGNYQLNQTNYQGENLRISGYAAQLNTTHTFSLPKNFSMELTGFYKSRSYMGVLQIRPQGFVNIGLQKKLKGDKGNLSFTISDLFWNMRFEAVNNLPSLDLYQRIGIVGEPRVIRLTYSRNFGNKNIKVSNQRKTASEEERNRLGN